MCFSTQADLVAGAALVPLGVLALRQVRTPFEIPLASLPLLFGAHQLVESLVWAGAEGDVPGDVAMAAAWVYVVFALPVLPVYVPLAVYLHEDRRHRRRVLPFLVLGALVTGLMTQALVQNGLEVHVHEHALGYDVGLGPTDWLSTSLYVVAVIGSCVVGSSWTLRAFAAVNLVGLVTVALTYTDALASLWCIFAAVSSVLLLIHLVHHARDHGESSVGRSVPV